MDGLYLVARTYWALALGFVLTFAGVWLVANFGVAQDVLGPALVLGGFGYAFAVFGREPWRFRDKGDWKPVAIFVHWPGLAAFVVAALIPIVLSVGQYGWTQLNTQMMGILVVVAVLTAARGVWELRRNKR